MASNFDLIQSRAGTIPCAPLVGVEQELRVPKAASAWMVCEIRAEETLATIAEISLSEPIAPEDAPPPDETAPDEAPPFDATPAPDDADDVPLEDVAPPDEVPTAGPVPLPDDVAMPDGSPPPGEVPLAGLGGACVGEPVEQASAVSAMAIAGARPLRTTDILASSYPTWPDKSLERNCSLHPC